MSQTIRVEPCSQAHQDSPAIDYATFLATKRLTVPVGGFTEDPSTLNPQLFAFQKAIVSWALARGKAAIFAGTGLGKSGMQLVWAQHVAQHTQGNVLLLAPLAVGQQTLREAAKFGVADQVPVRLVRSQAEVGPGINIANYEMLGHFDAATYAGIVLDESSILKNCDGATMRQILAFCATIPYRLACTATPAPNDTTELLTHAEVLGIMQRKACLSMFFRQADNSSSVFVLRPHARQAFWRWVSRWAVAIRAPSDLGYDDGAFRLPPLHRYAHVLPTAMADRDTLLPMEAREMSARIRARRHSVDARVRACAALVNASPETWIIWCHLNAEAEALCKAIPDAVEIRGTDAREQKEQRLAEFLDGKIRVLVSKVTVCGFGLNMQICSHLAFVGLSDSFEELFQATRRCWRFGQTRPVHAHYFSADTEGAVVRNVERKEREATIMMEQLVQEMKGLTMEKAVADELVYSEQEWAGPGWTVRRGDSVELIDTVDDNAIALTVTSCPFPSMYQYTNSPRDIGNVQGITDMIAHARYVFGEDNLLRATMPGRHCVIHMTQAIATLTHDDYIGIKDFRGALIAMMEDEGWIFYGEAVIAKNPQVKAIRVHDRGLLFKSLATDSSHMHMALCDTLLQFRKPGVNPRPIRAGQSDRYHNPDGWITQEEWIRWANGLWTDIKESDVLNVAEARSPEDGRHVCLARGALVLTQERGYVPIETVIPGEHTLTHLGRWRPVLAVQNTGMRECITVRAHGTDITLTPDHKVWARTSSLVPSRERSGAIRATPDWIEASASAHAYLNCQLPAVEDSPLNKDEWWLVGRWLADGHIGTRGDFFVSIGPQKLTTFLAHAGAYSGTRRMGTATQIRLKNMSPALLNILRQCGRGAAGKHLPPEAYGVSPEHARALLHGYLSGDGHCVPGRDTWMATSISKRLLLGIAMLAQRAHGAIASVRRGRRAGTACIEGRTVSTHDEWVLSFNIPHERRHNTPFLLEDGAWKKVRSIVQVGPMETWNIRVEEDESFTAEGCIVKNCPLQLEVCERAIKLWSGPGDLVFDPFAGIGSVGFTALQLSRQFLGFELKESYAHTCVKNMQRALATQKQLAFA